MAKQNEVNNETKSVNVQTAQDMRCLSIGRVWDNSSTATGKQPKLRIVLDRNLGINITLTPGAELMMFENTNKREGKKDADYRLAVNLPSAIVEAEIKRQTKARETATATA